MNARHASAVCCALLLGACAVGPDFVPPRNSLHQAVLAPGPELPGIASSDAAVPAEWWTLFDDALLTGLQARAARGNLDLQAAAERIAQSRAQLGIAGAALWPDVSAGAGYSRDALSANGRFAALGAPDSPGDFWQLGFDTGWELDLWGRARRAREGAAATLQAVTLERAAVRVAVAAEVARNYLVLRGAQAQADIARQNVALAERLLGLTESRARNGVATRFDTASARAQLATVKAALPSLTQRRNAAMNALALLLGENPRALDAQLAEAMPLPAFPAVAALGIPSALAQRRPDIQAAEARLHAATAAIGVARADFYPRVTLRGRVGAEAFNSGDLASWNSRFFSAGPTVYIPLFQGGRLAQRLALSEAGQRAAALAYRQTVLQAWHEVANALDALAAQRARRAELLPAHAHYQQAFQAAERAYTEGAADYLQVLTAQRDLFASQTSLDSSATDAALALVSLYKALGGGWDPGAFGVLE